MTGCLIRLLQAQGCRVAVAKPFESGGNQDGRWLRQLSGQSPSWDRWAFPYKLSAPMAPAMAAAKQGVSLSLKKVIDGLHTLESKADVLLVEGAGGALVPIKGSYCVADLMAELGYPAIVVSRLGLGSINHSLLTIEALRARACVIAGIIFNQLRSAKLNAVEKLNPAVIARLTKVPVLGHVPFLPLRQPPSADRLRRYINFMVGQVGPLSFFSETHDHIKFRTKKSAVDLLQDDRA